MENSWKKGPLGNMARKVALGVGLATSLAGGAEASQLDLAKAQTRIELAQLKLKKAKTPKEISKAEEELVLAKGKLEEAKAKEMDERVNKTTSGSINNIGVAPKNKAETRVTHRKIQIKDDAGNVIGEAEEGSKDWANLEKKRIGANKHRPVFVVNPPNNAGSRGNNENINNQGRNEEGGGWRPFTQPGQNQKPPEQNQSPEQPQQ